LAGGGVAVGRPAHWSRSDRVKPYAWAQASVFDERARVGRHGSSTHSISHTPAPAPLFTRPVSELYYKPHTSLTLTLPKLTVKTGDAPGAAAPAMCVRAFLPENCAHHAPQARGIIGHSLGTTGALTRTRGVQFLSGKPGNVHG
jgi:hypothetical protein